MTSTTAADHGVTSQPPPRCPWWCTDTNDRHRLDFDSTGTDGLAELYRHHSRDVGAVSVSQDEAYRAGSAPTLDGAIVRVEVTEAMTGERARQVARDLKQAAHLLDQINRTAAPQ